MRSRILPEADFAMVWHGERARASPAWAYSCGCDHIVWHVGNLQLTNLAPPALFFNSVPWERGAGIRWDPGAHLAMEVMLSLNMQDQSCAWPYRNISCSGHRESPDLQPISTALWIWANSYLPFLRRDKAERSWDNFKEIKWIGILNHEAAVPVWGQHHHAPWLGSSSLC